METDPLRQLLGFINEARATALTSGAPCPTVVSVASESRCAVVHVAAHVVAHVVGSRRGTAIASGPSSKKEPNSVLARVNVRSATDP